MSASFLRALAIVAIASIAIIDASAQTGNVMRFLGRYIQRPVAFDAASAEIVTYDPTSRIAIFSNSAANKITYLNMTDPANPTFVRDVLLQAYNGRINSVAVRNGIVAVALEDAANKAANGKVVFFDINGTYLNAVTVGALPDMLVFTPDGTRVVVCNEGEPLDNYAFDPEGSVSIINIANGVSAASVQTVSFTALNGKQDSLRAMGVRIYGPGSSVAQDLEPEYAAITPDAKTAYVTLQENNAIAVIDLPTATLSRVVALGFKDYSRGLPTVTKYPWTSRPVLGTTAAGQQILLGGFSGLWFTGYGADTNKLRFLTHPDRGPNAEPTTLRGQRRRPFALPNYQAEVVHVELDRQTGAFTILQRTPLFRTVGTQQIPISGRPNLQAAGQGIAYTDEFGVDLNGNDIPNDPFGADLEGIVVAADGTWWLVDEYRPAIYQIAPSGEMLGRHIAVGTAAAVGAAPGTYGTESLPAIYATRRANRGFEAVAIEGDVLYAFIQSPLDNPDDANDNASKRSTWCRILAFNVVTKQVVGEYLYPMFETAFGADKIGDAVSLGGGRFMVVERDDATGLRARKYLFEIDLKGATNLFTTPPTLPLGKTIEQLTFAECATYGVRPVYKRLSVYLPGAGYGDFDKVEGLARIDANTFALINDNDFGVGGSTLVSPPNGLITINNANIPVLGLLRFDRPNGFDGCDRDGVSNGAAINIRNWPVYGMYQPDAISVFTIGGQHYIASANEGDAREWGTYVEEARLSSSTIVLDPAFAAAWPNIKTNAQLARLNVVNNLGDIDGDGDFDQLYTLGGRSFSVWNADGNLIWDGGSEFETRLAALYPANFNAGHTTNAMDDRSDNKGPEPEGIATGVINDSTYAFVSLERIGHTMMYNVTDPTAPKFIDYVNSRNLAVTPNAANVDNGTVGDLGPEITVFVPAQTATNQQDLLIAGNEVSGTISTYQVRIPRILSTPPATRNVCVNDVLTLTVQATGPSLTYQWTRNGVDIVGATSATYTVPVTSTAQNGQYRCKVQAAGGMVITTAATTVSVFTRTLITQEPPTLIQRAATDRVTITIDATSGAGETYQWFRAGTALANGAKYQGVTTKQLVINDLQFADTSSAYYCVVTGGCSAPRTRNCAVHIPFITFTAQPTAVQACAGDTVRLSVAARPGGGDQALAYQWKTLHGGDLAESATYRGTRTPNLRIIAPTAVDTGTYYCIATAVPSGITRRSEFAQVRIPGQPGIQRELGPATGDTVVNLCERQTTTLSVLASIDAARYEWYRDGAIVEVGERNALTVASPGRYSVRVYDACNRTYAQSRTVRVVVRQRPEIGLQPQGSALVKEGDDYTLTFTLVRGSEELSYQWFRDDIAIVGATQAEYRINGATLTDAGIYTCRIQNVCGTAVTRRAEVRVYRPVTTSVDDVTAGGLGLHCSPNPFRDQATIDVSTPRAGALAVRVLDVIGRPVLTLSDGVAPAGVHRFVLEATALPASGVYTVVIDHAAGSVTRQVVLQR